VAIIEACGLTKNFGQTAAVEELSLQVEEGDVLGFLGPNGAGKTTTIRMLTGIIAPTSGYATIAGQRTDDNVEKLHEAIGLLTESPGFYDRLSARRNLEYFASFYPGLNTSAQVEKYLRLMGLWDRREDRVGGFSKGMKQRLALARALLHEPAVLFLDEPTSGLDPEASQEVRQMIGRLSSEGRTIFLSTHNLAEAELLCHRIAVIRTRLLVMDTGEELRRRFFHRQVVIQLEAPDKSVVEAVRDLTFVQDVREESNELFIELADPEKNRPELVRAIVEAGGRILEVTERQHPLEEVYLRLIREEANRDS
jgi:ABC-2 type transport system ATP-binding protein